MNYSLTLTHVADHAVHDAIHDTLIAFNQSMAGPNHGRPLVLVIRDTAGILIGGLSGYTSFGWLFIELLVIPEPLRGQGLGRQMMAMVEDEARQRGCENAWLDTFEFQARGFYEKLGYTCFAELPDYPRGYARYFMRKSLVPDRSAGRA